MVLAVAVLGCVIPQAASADGAFALSTTAKPYSVCPEAEAGKAECLAIRVPTVPAGSAEATGPDLEGGGELGGFDSKELREAYKLPETGGSSQTVAIVDAYNDPYAESDLQKYREKYKDYFKGTETACTETNDCFKKVNQSGETKNYPENRSEWSGEISLDVDMVSSACPECHILLVEASNEEVSNLIAANAEAVKLKATEVSNSWGTVDFPGETSDDKSLDHPGIPILAAAGDVGYDGCDHQPGAGICYPAASRYVIAVGGTKLTKESKSSRKWTEEVWSKSGSGCSKYETKPPWQTGPPWEADTGCTHRTDNDVAADASLESAVSVCDSYISGCWEDFGGTSVSSPFVAGVEALATSATKLLAADAFYKKPGMLFHVSVGSNGSCGIESEPTWYRCHATKEGYNGPTGEGTPDGVFESTAAAVGTELATKVASKEATLNGLVNPNGLATKYYLEYGTTESYGKKTEEVSAGSGTSNLEESQAITGLTAGTTYHFRIVATNSNGTTDGLDEVFTTTVGPPENTAPPVASPETPDQAVPESTTTGTWTNSPTSYAYQWELCNATGGECAAISGATSSKYTPVEADVEHTLVVKVTAKNSGGESSALSKTTNKVKPIGQITEYLLPENSGPYRGITTGPDGNLWFTDAFSSKIGKVTTSGTITEYALPKGSYPYGIAAGPEDSLWFAERESSKIGKITTAGKVTEYSLPLGSEPSGITEGPDGNMWFTDTWFGKVGKITPSGTITEYSLPEGSAPNGIAAGPDGNLWFTNETGKIGKITTSGTITEYALPESSWPIGIAAGPDGNMWFTDYRTSKIGKITTSGTITEYSLPKGSAPSGIAAGPDGNLWFTGDGTNKIGKITTSGTVSEYSLPEGSDPSVIAAGPDDNMWFTDFESNKVGDITP
ncbi:MAG TPA: S8 family serine peptidase [Solirubrobacteraceae bacterium]|nr:S8 family serine peptidase [Solirubrobacteraceae bacterium]